MISFLIAIKMELICLGLIVLLILYFYKKKLYPFWKSKDVTESSENSKAFYNNTYYRVVDELISQADIKNPEFFKRVVQNGSLGLGESYMDGWWECDRLDILFKKIMRAKLRKKIPKNVKDILFIAAARLTNLQSRPRAWIVAKEHYDLGNDLFNAMLDPYMQYSCGYWKNATTLEQAQLEKLEMICQKLQLRAGMTLLDIGCGWGGLAQYAAKNYGVKVYFVTISIEQKILAEKLCEGLDVTILMQDYREMDPKLKFDQVVSVGMFEHVGPKNYETYFDIVKRVLEPDGLFLLHTIGRNITSSTPEPWINKYIFPNACLPSIRYIAEASESHFIMEDWHNFGADYDRTLMAWHERFVAAWPQLQHKYSERFFRMFVYYLNSGAGGFQAIFSYGRFYSAHKVWMVEYECHVNQNSHFQHSIL